MNRDSCGPGYGLGPVDPVTKENGILKKALLISLLLALPFASFAGATEVPVIEEPAPATLQEAEAQTALDSEAADNKECTIVEVDENGEKTFVTTHGPHCTTPYTCTIQEPGLGFGCTCTYRCTCAWCNGNFAPINCVLIDDGGCLSCPSY